MTLDVFQKSDSVRIKISAKSLRQTFEGCSLLYILNVCHGRCCSSPSSPAGIVVPILPAEIGPLTAAGANIKNGMLQPNPETRKCQFQDDNGLCRLHSAGLKPVACQLSPFQLNGNNTLVVKNRNRLLKCYQDKSVAVTPAYRAYRSVLVYLFGETETGRICERLDNNSGDFYANMPRNIWDSLQIIRTGQQKAHGRRPADTAEN